MASIVIALGDPIVRVFGEINNHFFQFNLNGVIERSRWENNPGVRRVLVDIPDLETRLQEHPDDIFNVLEEVYGTFNRHNLIS